jgi:hypothetical protein
MRAAVAQGGVQQHQDALAVVKRWASDAAARGGLAACEDALGILADIAMGAVPAPLRPTAWHVSVWSGEDCLA